MPSTESLWAPQSWKRGGQIWSGGRVALLCYALSACGEAVDGVPMPTPTPTVAHAKAEPLAVEIVDVQAAATPLEEALRRASHAYARELGDHFAQYFARRQDRYRPTGPLAVVFDQRHIRAVLAGKSYLYTVSFRTDLQVAFLSSQAGVVPSHATAAKSFLLSGTCVPPTAAEPRIQCAKFSSSSAPTFHPVQAAPYMGLAPTAGPLFAPRRQLLAHADLSLPILDLAGEYAALRPDAQAP